MNGHSNWNFDQPGSRGVATSKPEAIEDPPLALEINLAAGRSTDEEALGTLETLHQSLMDVLRENIRTSPTAAFLIRRHEALSSLILQLGVTRAEILPFVSVANIFSHLNLDWFIIG
jgi:hypothetical protein